MCTETVICQDLSLAVNKYNCMITFDEAMKCRAKTQGDVDSILMEYVIHIERVSTCRPT